MSKPTTNDAATKARAAHDRAVARRNAAEKALRYASFAGQPDAEKAFARAERAVERVHAKLLETSKSTLVEVFDREAAESAS